jgi:hypothetical protein
MGERALASIDSHDNQNLWLEQNCSRQLSPELELMQAVLWDAITLIQLSRKERIRSTEYAEREQQAASEAMEWILSDDEDWLFSFRSVCGCLGLNAACMRRGLGL